MICTLVSLAIAAVLVVPVVKLLSRAVKATARAAKDVGDEIGGAS